MQFLIFSCVICISSASLNPMFCTMKTKFQNLETDVKSVFESIKEDISTVTDQFRSKVSSLLSHDRDVERTHNDVDRSFFESLDTQNEQALHLFLKLLNSNTDWTFVGTRDGVTVERKSLSAGEFVSKADSQRSGKHACVRSIGIIDSSPEKVFK